MKKILKILSLTMIMVMAFSTTAFAAENQSEKKVLISDITIQSEETAEKDGIEPKAPAAPVTALAVSEAKIGSNGYVYVTVAVTGYGKNNYCTWDGIQATLSSVGTDGKPIVEVNYLTYKCGYATVGEHQFYFRTTSVNSPWNTESISGTITVY